MAARRVVEFRSPMQTLMLSLSAGCPAPRSVRVVHLLASDESCEYVRSSEARSESAALVYDRYTGASLAWGD